MKGKQTILMGLFVIGLPLLVVGLARATTITFFTDESTFLAASSTTLIDAEGIVLDTALTYYDPLVIDGVTFDATDTGASTAVCGKLACNGQPYDSALIVTTLGSPLEIDLSGAGSGFTAAGGIFGDIIRDNTVAVLRLFGVGNVLLDTQAVDVRFMGKGLPHSFFGWTVSGGEITSIEYDMDGMLGVLDDFRFGAKAPIPEPSTLLLLFTGLAGLAAWRRKKAA